MVRLRSFGKFSFRVTDSIVLLNTLVGTQNQVHHRGGDRLPEGYGCGTADRSSGQRPASACSTCRNTTTRSPPAHGPRWRPSSTSTSWNWSTCSSRPSLLRRRVQKAIDTRSAMEAVGDLNAFMRYQTAQEHVEDGRKRWRWRGDGDGDGSGLRHDDARHDPAGDEPAGSATASSPASGRPRLRFRPLGVSTSATWLPQSPIHARWCGR